MIMKKYFFSLMALFMIIYAGCKKDDTVNVVVVGCAN